MGANLIDIWAAVTEAGEDGPQPADKRAGVYPVHKKPAFN